MGKRSVYEGLKNALKVKNLPHYSFDDEQCTILFASWDQFEGFDKLLDSLPTPKDIKLNIYAETVADKTDGVAITVDDEIQHLSYWDMFPQMKDRVRIYEEFVSRLLRAGVELLDFSYEGFNVRMNDYNFYVFNYEYRKDKKRFAPEGVNLLFSNPRGDRGADWKMIYLGFPFD